MGNGNEYYHATPLAAGATVNVGPRIGGFLASAAGTITITRYDGTSIGLNAFPVVAGFNRIPVFSGSANGFQVTPSVAGALLS